LGFRLQLSEPVKRKVVEDVVEAVIPKHADGALLSSLAE
jgi:hypothetical protein